MTIRRRVGFSFVSIATIAVALFVGAQLAPAAERGDFSAETRGGNLEFVGRATQNGLGIAIVGYVTHVAGVPDADLFATTANPAGRNENTARITFTANTTISQSFMVLPQTPTLFDVNSAGTLTFFFTATPGARTFDPASGFDSGTPIAGNSVRFQDVVAALGGSIPIAVSSTVTASCVRHPGPRSGLPARPAGSGHPGTQQSIFTHGWTTRTNPHPPQSQTQFGGHTTVIGDGRC